MSMPIGVITYANLQGVETWTFDIVGPSYFLQHTQQNMPEKFARSVSVMSTFFVYLFFVLVRSTS